MDPILYYNDPSMLFNPKYKEIVIYKKYQIEMIIKSLGK
jgi:hypothetical protein